MMKLSLEYVAGLVDGEGCISLIKSGKSKNSVSVRRYPRVVVTNTHFGVLLLAEQFGGRVYVHQRPGEVTKTGVRASKPCFNWQTGSKQARDLLTAILPFLVIKQAKAKAVPAQDDYGKPRRKPVAVYKVDRGLIQEAPPLAFEA